MDGKSTKCNKVSEENSSLPQNDLVKVKDVDAKISELIIVWIIGSIGSGKSKLAELLITSMNWMVLETELAGASLIGLQTQHFNKNVSIKDIAMIAYFRNRIEFLAPEINGIIIDGFPITTKQAKLFIKHIKLPETIIYLDMSFDGMLAREQYKYGNNIDVQHLRKHCVRKLMNVKQIIKKYRPHVIKIFSVYPESKLVDQVRKLLFEKAGITIDK